MKLGILGGGQLGRMLMPALRELNIPHSILDSDPNCPAHLAADSHQIGDFRDYQTVLNFGKTVDFLTIEIEQVNVQALTELEQMGIPVFPSSKVIGVIQNKYQQKKFFEEHEIPSSPFRLLAENTDLSVHENFLPFVQKTCVGGYDGQGVMIHRDKSHLAQGLTGDCILEKLVDIDQELSVIVARNELGVIQTFPTVGQAFDEEAHLVKFVYAPAGISSTVDNQCQEIAIKLAEKFELVGLLAVEFFLSKTGEVLVNEVAPRCHNSGHWTQNGCSTSQFEQLIRAITNQPLGQTHITRPTVMVNILGSTHYTGRPQTNFFKKILSIPETHIHWYGKSVSKPFRKMGHVNVSAQTIEEAINKAEKIYTLLYKSTNHES